MADLDEGHELDLTLADDCVSIMRQTAWEKLGFNCTFADDDMAVLVHLAQRAVLAGLDSDFKPDMQRRFREACEPFRAEQEAALGREIKRSLIDSAPQREK